MPGLVAARGRRAAEVRDPAVAERQQVLGRRHAAGEVGRADAGHVRLRGCSPGRRRPAAAGPGTARRDRAAVRSLVMPMAARRPSRGQVADPLRRGRPVLGPAAGCGARTRARRRPRPAGLDDALDDLDRVAFTTPWKNSSTACPRRPAPAGGRRTRARWRSSCTRARVAWETSLRPLSTLETVATDTPAEAGDRGQGDAASPGGISSPSSRSRPRAIGRQLDRGDQSAGRGRRPAHAGQPDTCRGTAGRRDDVPTSTSRSPGSTIRRRSGPVYAVRSAWTRKVTSTASPGSSETRANPVSCFTGRATCGDHVVQVELDDLVAGPRAGVADAGRSR